jgi:hypothetical protein
MSADNSIEEARALLARIAPIADQVRAAIDGLTALVEELPKDGGGNLSHLRGELEEALEDLHMGLAYVTAQHENEDCTIAKLERTVKGWLPAPVASEARQ